MLENQRVKLLDKTKVYNKWKGASSARDDSPPVFL
jgi:hypothetical protein